MKPWSVALAALASVGLAAFLLAEAPAAPAFAKAEVKVHLDARGQPLARPKVITLTDADKVARLASFFPQIGRGDSGIAGGWIAAAEVRLVTADGKAVRVTVDPDYATWSEGTGDWPARPGLKKFIDGLAADAPPAEKP